MMRCGLISRRTSCACLLLVGFCCWTVNTGADDDKAAEGRSAEDSGVVAATVNDEPITRADVDRSLKQSLGNRTIAAAARPGFEAEALELLVGQKLILRRLKREKVIPDTKTLNAEVERHEQAALARFATFDEYLASLGHDAESYRQEITWRLAWQKYLDRNVGDEHLKSYFEGHRIDFDGTELKVSHIIFPVYQKDAAELVETRLEEARALREQLVAGKLKFADAAKKYSSGPSREKGGDLGFMGRQGDMPEEFSRAAFALKVGEVSEPVVTHFGVHLITVTEVRPGKLKWSSVRGDLYAAVIRELFTALVAEERKTAKVVYKGTTAYRDPESGGIRLPME